MQHIITHILDLQSARFYNSFENTTLAFCVDALSPHGLTVADIKGMISWLHDPDICLYASHYQEQKELFFLAQEIEARAIICNNVQAKDMLFPHIILLEEKNIAYHRDYTQAVMVTDVALIQDIKLPYFLSYSKNRTSEISEQLVGFYADASMQDMYDEEWIRFLEI